ncbi:MAG: hypothetical protein FWF67_06455, partial [Fibromonadales bacterium]|nr:hypothetical protein [Fibromonadales bacterium]
MNGKLMENGEWRMENKAYFQFSILNFQLIFVFALFLAACSPNFSNSHKLYSGVPAKSESVGYVEIGSAFMLTRADWFAEKLNIQYDSIYSKLEVITDSVIFDEIKKKWEASIVSREARETFSRETLKMDKTIFIKTRLPEQGVEVSIDSNNTPNYLFIIHEYTIGGDLDAENFYDYTKANVEMSQKR